MLPVGTFGQCEDQQWLSESRTHGFRRGWPSFLEWQRCHRRTAYEVERQAFRHDLEAPIEIIYEYMTDERTKETGGSYLNESFKLFLKKLFHRQIVVFMHNSLKRHLRSSGWNNYTIKKGVNDPFCCVSDSISLPEAVGTLFAFTTVVISVALVLMNKVRSFPQKLN